MLQKTIWCSKAVWDTTYSELPANRSQLLNPSVKCITTEDTIKLLSLFPNSNFSKQVSHICTLHTPSHPSILDRCIHVQVSTTIVQVTSAHLKVPTTFLIKCLCAQAISILQPDVSIIIIYILGCLQIISSYPLPRYRFQNISECILVQSQLLVLQCPSLCTLHPYTGIHNQSPVVKILYTSIIHIIKSQLGEQYS